MGARKNETSRSTGGGQTSVFVSYARADSALVDRLVADLEAAGHRCWRDTSDIFGGSDWLEAIAAGIEHADAFISVVTPAANASKWVQLEYLHAHKQGKRVIPVKAKDCDLPWYLRDRQAVDIVPDYTTGLERLLRSILALPRGASAATAGDGRRERELAYLHRLQLQELLHSELYTPMAGVARLSGRPAPLAQMPSVVMRPELVHLRHLTTLHVKPSPTERRPFEDISAAFPGEVRQAVLLGEPGAGKTTTLFKVAREALDVALTDVTAPIPLLVRLGGWTKERQPLESFIAESIGPLGPFATELLGELRTLLLLDGLHEIPSGQRAQKTAQVRELLGRNRALPALVSCRELDYTESLDLHLDTVTILPLDPLRILEFVTAYLTAAVEPEENDPERRARIGRERGEVLFWALGGGDDVRKLWEVWQTAGADLAQFWSANDIPRTPTKITWLQNEARRTAVHDPHSLMRLASNPYLLFMLTSVYLDLGEIPANRAALLLDFVEVLLLRERLASCNAQTRAVRISAQGQALLTGLGTLAWEMQTHAEAVLDHEHQNTLVTLPRVAAASHLGTVGLRLAAGSSILAVGEHEVRFTHQLLQEHFAAIEMRARLEAELLVASALWPADRWWERSGWEEATVLLAGLYGEDCTPVLDWLSTTDPEVAAQCILYSGATVPTATLERLRALWKPRLMDLAGDPAPEARAAIGRALAGPRLAGQPLDDRKGVSVVRDSARGLWLPDIDWVEVPAGEFIYQWGERVELPRFYIARYPVTNDQFQAFVNDPQGYADPVWWTGLEQPFEYPETPWWHNDPWRAVSWYEAVAFCRWLTKRLGFEVRLPTEREWEKAARGTDGREYPWGNGYRAGCANVNEQWNQDGPHRLRRSTAVGIYPQDASPWGVRDLAGNVSEWCADRYEPARDPDPAARRRHGGDWGATVRVVRGGSWYGSADSARATHCWGYGPGDGLDHLGFRVCCAYPEL